ncbi:MAG TPA: exodeoxyribonuclease VII small subunit [Bacteroidota bacterium]|nr:exodeoxyribonuclease VII small subunit [Bacteroidota bacterium]
MAKKQPAKPSFEHSMSRLEEIVQTLEQGDASLEESIALYEEGARLAKELNETLAHAELRIQQITKNINGSIDITDYE